MNDMKNIRRSIHILMILPLLAIGLPHFCAEDANRDHDVNLEDAILHVKNVASSAERPSQFGPSVKNAISTFQVLAELDERITPSQDASPAQPDVTFLVSSGVMITAPGDVAIVTERSCDFETVTTLPDTHPPKHA